ncbi:MAG: putative metalloprotease CJM1_0395 family protein, partial [Methylococcales bacterium]
MQISSASYYADLSKSYLTQSATAQNNTQTNTSPLDKSTSIQQQQEIQALKSRDQEVRNHEQAHLNAAGGLAVSGAHFSYTTGPDGQRYAVGGDVSIDIAEVADDPQATLNKADIIRRAAMAPAQPSAQDFSVASKAAAMANKARTELL